LFTPHERTGMSVVRRITLTLQRCTITAMRSCPEWELHAFSHAAALLGKPLVPLGLLPPSPLARRRAWRRQEQRRRHRAVAGRAATQIGRVRRAG
jgi:hypothetical protein